MFFYFSFLFLLIFFSTFLFILRFSFLLLFKILTPNLYFSFLLYYYYYTLRTLRCTLSVTDSIRSAADYTQQQEEAWGECCVSFYLSLLLFCLISPRAQTCNLTNTNKQTKKYTNNQTQTSYKKTKNKNKRKTHLTHRRTYAFSFLFLSIGNSTLLLFSSLLCYKEREN